MEIFLKIAKGLKRHETRSCPMGKLLVFLFFWQTTVAFAGNSSTNDATLKVSGYGFFGDLQLKNLAKTFDDKGKHREFYDANFIEDTVLILMSRVSRDGYLKPTIAAHLTLEDGTRQSYDWSGTMREPIPRPLKAKHVEFEIQKGVFYFFDAITFEGLTAMTEKEARAFFVESGALVKFKGARAFTPGKLQRGLSSLGEVLERKGHDQVEVTQADLDQNDETGAVQVKVLVKEGPRFLVRSIRSEFFYGTNVEPAEVLTVATNAVFSKLWLQDFAQALRATNYHRGYPDTKVEIARAKQEATNNQVHLDLVAKVKSGEKMFLSSVKFTGLKKTKEVVLKRRVRLKKHHVLDRIETEKGRYRLARLGIFDSVGIRYDQVDDHTRNVVYELKEGKEVDVSMLLGFGSYELLRLGFEVNQYNVFGRAHRARFRIAQSFKSSSADYLYTMPELVGEDLDVFFNASGLRREEVSFTREEYGGGAGARKFLPSISSDFGVRYNYQILNAVQTKLAQEVGLARAAVGSVTFDLKHDKRDNPLYPRAGYKLAGSLETASKFLAGDVNFERLDLSASYHLPLTTTTWLHLGLSHGLIFTQGNPRDELPFNKRFFTGGENSVRGYQQGEAAPRNAQGKVIGAETYLTGNVEIEQALTEKWSLVAFSDSIGFAREFANYPFDETLFSIGLGVRWKTVIGPIRLEYGHNLNPRKDDPAGTLHFSIGFPF
ncbi:MAG: BamA/TamA family outer membrane protein [Verrucomicrobiota bacterium]